MSTLFINHSKSRCGACNRNADPYEETHANVTMAGEGCGARYTQVSTDYFQMADLVSRIKEMRPDLPYVGWSEQ